LGRWVHACRNGADCPDPEEAAEMKAMMPEIKGGVNSAPQLHISSARPTREAAAAGDPRSVLVARSAPVGKRRLDRATVR
jgi:hypothetical protein